MQYLDTIDRFIGLENIGDHSTIVDRLRLLSSSNVSDLAFELWRDLPKPKSGKGANRFVADSRLSGLPHPCSGFECRSTALSEVAGFAATYSDEMVLFNPFRRLVTAARRPRKRGISSYYVEELGFHISELLTLRPLIERGMISFDDEENGHLCRDCFLKALEILRAGEVERLQVDQLYFKLLDRFSSSVTVTVESHSKRRPTFTIMGPEDLLGHETVHASARRETGLDLRIGHVLSREEIIQVGVGEQYAHYSSSELIRSNALCEEYGFTNVVASSPHIAIIRDYFGERFFARSIDLEYPLLSGGTLSDILSFRDAEWHHLHDFRRLVEDGLAEGKNVSRDLKDASAKIEGILQKNRRTMRKGLLKDAGITAIGITASVLTGGFATLMGAASSALTGGHLAKGVIPRLVEGFSEPEELREERSYFAWKVKRRFG